MCVASEQHDARSSSMCVGCRTERNSIESPYGAFRCHSIYTRKLKKNKNLAVPFGVRAHTSLVRVLSRSQSIFSTTSNTKTHTQTKNRFSVDNKSSRESICARSFAMFHSIFYFFFSFSLRENFFGCPFLMVDLFDDNKFCTKIPSSTWNHNRCLLDERAFELIYLSNNRFLCFYQYSWGLFF